MSGIGFHHSEETKARIKAGGIENRAYQRLTRSEDELRYSYRYQLKCIEIHALKEDVERRRILDEIAAKAKDVVAVRTFGQCSPASGIMLWKGGNYTLVWFDGCDAPMVWPAENIEVAEDPTP